MEAERLAAGERRERRGAGAVADELRTGRGSGPRPPLRSRRRGRRAGRRRPRGSAPRPSGPSTSSPASLSAAARAWPKPAGADDGAAQGRGLGGVPVQFSHEIPAGRGASAVVFEVRPVVVTASPPMIPRSVRVPVGPPAAAGATLGAMPSAEQRREELKAVYRQASVCTRCPQLASTRQTVVFGSGNADADLMFVGEAPGANEDKQGVPFVGQAGKLLDQLLGEIGLTRPDVFVVERPQVPASRQPRSAAAGDRQLPGLPVPPARADPAEGRLHARQLLDEAAARRSLDRHHEAPRPRGGPRHRAARRAAVPDLPPGRRALHALAARHAARRLRPAAGPARARPAAAARAGRSPSRWSRSPRSSRRSRPPRRSRRRSRRPLSSGCSDPPALRASPRRRGRTGSAGGPDGSSGSTAGGARPGARAPGGR